MMGAELLCQFALVGAARNRHDLEAHVTRILHRQVTEPANAEYRDEIARLRRRVSQCAERRESGTKQRRRVNGGQIVGNRHETARLGEQDFGIAAVVMNSGVFLVLTVHKVAAAAKFAITARAGEKADADPLADLPTANARSHPVNAPDDLVARNPRIGNAREASLDCRGVRVAHSARLDANAHLVVAGILKRPPHFSELSWSPYLNGFVRLAHFVARCSTSGREAILPRRIQRIGSTPACVRTA